MVQAIKRRVRIGAGGRIEIEDASLPEGAEAEVIVLLGEATVAEASDRPPPMPLDQIIGSGKGGFGSVEEIDQYIRDLRDEWD